MSGAADEARSARRRRTTAVTLAHPMPPARRLLRFSLRLVLESALILLIVGLFVAIWLPVLLGGSGE